jgi:sugar O-acyltransferase (sialic acid O-acetyltransferase NeuD family)
MEIKKMKKIAIIGAGGFGKEVFCIWKDMLESKKETYDFIGYFDDNEDLAENTYGPVRGKIEELNTINEPIEVAIALGNTHHLKVIREKISNHNISFPNIIHPSVKFLDINTILLGEGNIFSLNVILSCDIKLGSFNIFNTRATLGHDVKVGNYNIFSPNAQISGMVTIGNQNYFGFNCGVIQCKNIGNLNTVGAGAILLRSIENEGTYIGVPAKKLIF